MDSGFENPDLGFTPGSDPVPGVPYTDIEPNDVVIDVRSPSEYEVDHLPEAINVPLLDDMKIRMYGSAERLVFLALKTPCFSKNNWSFFSSLSTTCQSWKEKRFT